MNGPRAYALGLLLLGSAVSAGAGARPPADACKVSVAVSAHRDSFESAGHDSSPERLAGLAAATRARFVAAARRLCAAGILRPADLARFRTLIVQNGEGATEPVLMQELMARDFYVFQYAFQNGGPPQPAEFEQALRCWKRPSDPACDFGD